MCCALACGLVAAPHVAVAQESSLSPGPGPSETVNPYAEVVIEAASKTGTSSVTPDSDPNGPPTQTGPGSDVSEPSLLFGQGREGVISIAAKYVLPKGHNAHGMTAGSFRVTATLPAGLTFVRSTSAYADDVEADYGMTCAPDAAKVHCTVKTRLPTQAAVLRSARWMRIYLVVRAADGLVKVDASDKTKITTALGDITAEMSVETVMGPLSASTRTPAIASEGYQPPRLTTTLQPLENLGHKRSFRLVFHNIGGLPAVPVGKHPALWFDEVLPHMDPDIPFTVTGAGWSCDQTTENTANPTRCKTRQRLELGAMSEPVIVTWYPLSGDSAKEREIYYEWQLDTKASWTTTETIRRTTKRYGGQRCQKFPFRWRLRHLTPARLDVHILAGKGLDVRQGGSQAITLRVGNIGQTPAKNVGLRIALPAHTTLTTQDPAWTCTAGANGAACAATGLTIQPGKRAVLKVTVSAATDARVGNGRLRVTPSATAARASAARSIPITIKDIGDPEATPTLQFARANGGWRTWSNGSVTQVMVGDALTYRVQIANRGGNVVPQGDKVRISQAIGSGVTLVNAEASNGGTCALKPLVCTITTAASVAPGQQIGTVTITVIPRKVTKLAALGLITTTVENEPGDETVPVPVKVIPTDRTLRVSSHIKRIPDVGGLGDIELRVVNLQPRGTSVENIKVSMPLPAGIVIERIDGNLWTCTVASGRATCAFGAALPGRTKSPVAHITIKAVGAARETPKPKPLLWRATGTTVGSGTYEYGISHLRLPIRKAIKIAAEASPQSLAPSKRPKHLRSVVLTGSNSVGNGVSLDYQWKQRCTSASDELADCARHGVAPAVRITSPTAAVARALVPAVTKRTTFVFELTISDGSSTQTKVVTVSAAAKAPFTQGSEKQQSGATAATAAKRAAQQAAQQAAEQKRAQSAKQEASAALKQQAKQAANAKTQAKGLLKVNAGGGLVTAYADTEVELRATVTGGDGRHTIKWQQTSGASVTLQGDTSATAKLRAPSTPGYLAFTVTATDADGHTARSAVTVQVEPKGSAPIALNVKIAGAPELIAPAGKPIALVAHTTGGVGKVTYRWSQTQGAATPLANATSAVARVTVPRAASAVQVQVTARDAKGTVATATVSVAPPGAPPVISFVDGATTAAALGAKATIATTVTGGTGDLKYQWTQLGGTATVLENAEKATLTTTLPRRQSINTYQLTVTDKTGQISTAVATISVGAPPNGVAYCSILKKSAGSAPVNVPLGPNTSVTFRELSSASTSCGSAAGSRQSDSTAAFSNTSFTFGGITVTNASGSVSPSFISITSGTVTTPSSWRLPATSIGTEPLTVAFSGAKGSTGLLTGSLNVAGFPFLTLPSGWSGTSSLSFAPNTGNTASVVTVGATATNGTGTVTVGGTATTAGVFTATVTADDLLNVGDATVDLAGSVSNATGTVTSTITGSLASPATLVSGVQLSALTATWQTRSSGPIATGTATIGLTAGSDTSALTAAFSYTDAANWSATLKGSGTGVWTPVSGLNLSPADFAGSITQTKGVWAWNITATDTDWQASSVLDFTKTTIDLSNSCTSKTLKCPSSSMFMQISTTATLGTSSANQMTASVQAVFGLGAEPGFSAAGTFSGSFTAAPSLVLKISGATFTVDDPTGTDLTPSLTIPTATLQTPDAWRLPVISVGSTPIALTFTGPNNATPQIVGSLTAPGFPFLTLPSGWSGTTSLAFASGPSNAYATFNATANDGSTGTVDLSATINGDSTFTASVTADNLVTIGGSSLDLAGTATDTTGTTVASVSGSIASPINLAPGVNLTTLTANWTNATDGPVIGGVATVAISSGSETPTALTAKLAYTSTTDWNVTLTASGGPTWEPISGLQIQPSDFSGSIGKSKGAWEWNIEADIPTWNVTSILTLTDIKLDLSNSCTQTTLICPAADMFMLLSTNVALDAPLGVEVNAAATAVFGIGGKPGFSLYAGLTQDLDIAPGVSLGSPSFAVNYDLPEGTVLPTTGMPSFSSASESGWNVNVLGNLSVPGLGNFGDIAASFSSLGISLGGWDPNGVSLGGSSNGTQSGTAFGWSSFAATMTATLPNFGIQTLTMQPGEFSIQGGYTPPDWWGQMTSASLGMMLGTIQFDPETGFFNAKISFGGGHSIPAGGSQLAVSQLFFDIQFNTTGLTVSAGGTTDLSITALGGSSQTAPTLTFEISFDIGTNALSGTLEFQDATGWNNAFGVDGLVIEDLAISLGITLDPPIPLPSLGLYAAGDLPPSLMQAFGVDNGVPISMTADLSEATPCLAISVGSSKGNTPIMDIGDGALTATYFEFSVAPDGCTVGTSTIPAGMSMAFDGAVFGTTVDIAASLSLEPTIFNASFKMASFSIPGTGGAISFQDTTIAVELNALTNTDSVTFSGGFSMFGTTIDVSGSLTKTPDSVDASLQVSQPQPLTVAGFSLSNLMISVNVEYGPGVENVSVAAAGDMNIMGTILDVSMAATIDNGIVEYVDVSATLQNLTLGPATMNGSFNGSYTAATDAFDVAAAVTLTVSGFSMQATLDISPQCVAFTGALNVPSVFTAQLAGTMIYQANCAEQVTNAAGTAVTGAPGDFSFAANNVDLAVAGFDIGGSVGVGSVGGDFYATVAASVDLVPQSSNDEVSVQGSFQSNGDFSFNGQGELDIGGFMLQVQVAVASQGGNESISGSADLNVAGIADVSISGQFTMIGGQPSTTLTGSENISLGGFNISNAQFTLSQTPTSLGLQATLAINLGVVNVNGTLTFIENGSAPPLYYLAADGDLNIGVADLVLNAIFTNCTDSTCSTPANATSLTMTGDATLFGTAFNLPTFFISSDGVFSITSSASGSACTGTITIPLVTQLQGCFAYTENLVISNVAPYFSTTDTATLSVNGDRWNFLDGPEACCCRVCWWFGSDCTELCVPEGGWTAWESWGSFSAGIEFQADPFSLGIELFGTWFTI